MIKQILNETVVKIEAQRQRDVEVEKQRAMREEIVPFNAEIDDALKNAVAEKSAQLSQSIAAFQAKFEEEKKALVEAAEKKKSEFMTTRIDAAVAIASVKYDDVLKNIKKYIDKQGE